jgi:hypothetical protein
MIEDNDLNDPEDAYDVSDPPKQRLLNFARRVNYLIDHVSGHAWDNDHVDVVRERISDRLERLRDDLDKLRSQLDD